MCGDAAMLKPFKDKNYAYLTYPKLTVVVTAGIPGRATAMAASWHTYLSLDPPLYGVSIAPKRFTHKLITEHREFGVNFLPFELSKLIWDVGSVSGAKIDKFEKFNIKTFNGEKIRAPLIADSIVVLECKVTDTVRTGDHDFFIGEIVYAWYREDLFSKDYTLDVSKASQAYYLGKGKFIATDPRRVLEFL